MHIPINVKLALTELLATDREACIEHFWLTPPPPPQLSAFRIRSALLENVRAGSPALFEIGWSPKTKGNVPSYLA